MALAAAASVSAAVPQPGQNESVGWMGKPQTGQCAVDMGRVYG